MQPPSRDLRPASGAVAEGLTFSVDPARPELTVGTFRKGEDVLRIEVLVGERNPTFDPQAPEFAVDVRIADQDGIVFYLQQGGDKMIDPTWEQDLGAPADLTRRLRANELLGEIAGALAEPAQQQFVKANRPVFGALNTISRSVTLRKSGALAVSDALDVTPVDMKGQADYRHGFAISKGNIAGGLGHHTATWLTVQYGTGMVTQRSNCNHGRCWDDYANGMSLTCSRSLTTTSSTIRGGNQLCGTVYDWNSNAGHNCHDDTRLTNRAWYNNVVYSTSGTTYQNYCVTNNSTYDTIYAPSCYP